MNPIRIQIPDKLPEFTELLKTQILCGFMLIVIIALVYLSWNSIHDATIYQVYKPYWDGLSNGTDKIEPVGAICSQPGFGTNFSLGYSQEINSSSCDNATSTCGPVN